MCVWCPIVVSCPSCVFFFYFNCQCYVTIIWAVIPIFFVFIFFAKRKQSYICYGWYRGGKEEKARLVMDKMRLCPRSPLTLKSERQRDKWTRSRKACAAGRWYHYLYACLFLTLGTPCWLMLGLTECKDFFLCVFIFFVSFFLLF